MAGYLLDTNVISEMTKRQPHVNVAAFLSREEDLWIPVLVTHELEYGVRRLPYEEKRYRLELAITVLIAEFDDHIIPLYRDAADLAAEFRAHAEWEQRKLTMADALIASTAVTQGLILVTRNVKDFDYLSVEIVNPWLSGRPSR